MLVTHDMLKKSTPVCIAFNHMPWHYLAVARLDIGGQRKHFIWKTNFKKRLEWDGSFTDNGSGTGRKSDGGTGSAEPDVSEPRNALYGAGRGTVRTLKERDSY